MLSLLSIASSLNWIAGHFPRCVFAACFLVCTGPLPVHFCGPQPEGGYVYVFNSRRDKKTLFPIFENSLVYKELAEKTQWPLGNQK